MSKSTTSRKKVTADNFESVKFAGIDYHKRFSMVALGDREGNLIGTYRIENTEIEVVEFFSRFTGVTCAVESCRGYEWIVDLLKSIGIQVFLSNPYQTKLIVQSRCKTDKVDARSIMQLLAIGYLPLCYIPKRRERELRERLRWRVQLVREASRLKIKIRCLLDKENLGETVRNPFTTTGKKILRSLKMKTRTRQRLLHELISMLDEYDRRVKIEDAWVKKTAKTSSDATLLMSIPGIGALSALVILAELGDISRFKRADQVVAYAGMAPSVYSSADSRRYGRLTKQGPPLIRWVIVQDAWQAVRFSPELRLHYLMVKRRVGNQGAIISLSRKLLKISYRVLRDKKPYDSKLVGAA